MNDCSNHIIFAECLEKLAKHSRKIGKMRGLDNGFCEMQKLRAWTQNNDLYFGYKCRKKLDNIAEMLENDYRDAIELKKRVKKLSANAKKINKAQGLD